MTVILFLEANPEKFNSRFGNMVKYAHYGMAEFIRFNTPCREMWKHVTLKCDNIDMTDKLHEIHAVSLIVLNIPSYRSVRFLTLRPYFKGF